MYVCSDGVRRLPGARHALLSLVPRPAACRVCHALRRGAWHCVGYAALSRFAGDAGSARFRGERLVLLGRAACKSGACRTALPIPEVVLQYSLFSFTTHCQASELSAHTLLVRATADRRPSRCPPTTPPGARARVARLPLLPPRLVPCSAAHCTTHTHALPQRPTASTDVLRGRTRATLI